MFYKVKDLKWVKDGFGTWKTWLILSLGITLSQPASIEDVHACRMSCQTGIVPVAHQNTLANQLFASKNMFVFSNQQPSHRPSHVPLYSVSADWKSLGHSLHGWILFRPHRLWAQRQESTKSYQIAKSRSVASKAKHVKICQGLSSQGLLLMSLNWKLSSGSWTSIKDMKWICIVSI